MVRYPEYSPSPNPFPILSRRFAGLQDLSGRLVGHPCRDSPGACGKATCELCRQDAIVSMLT